MTNIIVSFFTWLRGLFDAIMPTLDGSFSTNITSAISYMANLIAAADFLIPVADIFAILGIVIAIKFTMFGAFCVNWVLRFIP